MTEIAIDQEVYTEDGRRCVYAGEIGGQKFVRYLRADSETGGEWPSDRLSPVARVFLTEPVEVFGAEIAKKQADMAELQEHLSRVRQEIADSSKNKAAIEREAERYPDIALILDFIEGRITHVVEASYGAAEIKTTEEALPYLDDHGRHKGLKLLAIHGHEAAGYGKRRVSFQLNRYYDGSGSNTTIYPARSEEEARGIVKRLFDERIADWRSKGHDHSIGSFLEKHPWLEAPTDWAEWNAAEKEKARQGKIKKLKDELASLEGRPS